MPKENGRFYFNIQITLGYEKSEDKLLKRVNYQYTTNYCAFPKHYVSNNTWQCFISELNFNLYNKKCKLPLSIANRSPVFVAKDCKSAINNTDIEKDGKVLAKQPYFHRNIKSLSGSFGIN